MIDLKRLKEYVDIGFTREEALELVQKEAGEEDAKEKSDADSLKEEIKTLKEQLDNKEEKKEETKEVEVKKEAEKSMTIEEAFKNIFVWFP